MVKAIQYAAFLSKTMTHPCGMEQTLPDGTVIVDMPLGSPSTCNGTYSLVASFQAGFKQGSLTPDQLTDMISTLGSLSKAGTSFADLWSSMPKAPSGDVELSAFEAMFHSSLMDIDNSGTVSWLEAGNYNHAVLEVGGEAGVFDPNEVCAWAGCA